MARARDLISLLINITLSQKMPFHQLQQRQCLYYGTPLCPHSFFTLQRKVMIYSGHEMASTRDVKIVEALSMLTVLTKLCHC